MYYFLYPSEHLSFHNRTYKKPLHSFGMSAETGTSLAAERRYVGVVGTALTDALLLDGLLDGLLVLCSLQNERIIRFCFTVVKSSLYILKNGQLVRRGVGERGVSIFIFPFLGQKNISRITETWKKIENKTDTLMKTNKNHYIPSVLRIRDVLSRILIFTHPGSRIKKQQQKRGEKKFVMPFYVATNFTKLNIILVLKCWGKKFGPFSKNYRTFYSKNCSVADPDEGSGAFLTPGSGIGFFRIPDPKSIFLRAYWQFLG